MAPEQGAFNLVIVPLDGSPFAEHALPCAAAIARASRAKLRLVLVHELPPPPTNRESMRLYAQLEVAVRKSQRSYLREVAGRLRERWGVQVKSVSPDGPVGPALTNCIRDMDADLVVMATHGRGALGRTFLGSVADHVVRTAGVPVLLVRPPLEETPPPVDWRPEEILVPLDGSRLAETAISAAAELARLMSARLTLLQVVQPITAVAEPPLPAVGAYDGRLTDIRRREAADYLESVAGPLRDAGLAVATAAVVGGGVAGTLLGLARPDRAGLIVIASHGRGGLKRIALGSVADKLVRAAEVPILVVRPTKRGGR